MLDSVSEAVSSVAEDLGDRVGTQVTAVRRDLADRIDPAPVPRRGLRLLVLGLLVTTVSAVVWAGLSRRATPAPTLQHGSPEHLPPTALDDDLVAVEGVEIDTVDADEPPSAGLTGDPEARSN